MAQFSWYYISCKNILSATNLLLIRQRLSIVQPNFSFIFKSIPQTLLLNIPSAGEFYSHYLLNQKTMKTKFLMAALLAASIGIMGLSSCKKDAIDKPLEQSIVGKWNFTSFKLDSSEYLGTIIDSAFIEYKAISNGKGQFTQLVAFANEEPDLMSGEYTVNATTKSVIMTTETKTITSTVNIKDGKMDWVSTQDGKPLLVKAEKK